MPAIDMTGQRFGRLIVVARAPEYDRYGYRWIARCDCGNTTEARGSHLRVGQVKSCGCLLTEVGERVRTHGHAARGNYTPTYQSWLAMRQRTSTPSNDHDRRNYLDRGISVCDRWQDFANFLADMGERPEGMTLDRIDNDGNYAPGNCRWATPKEQRANTRQAT